MAFTAHISALTKDQEDDIGRLDSFQRIGNRNRLITPDRTTRNILPTALIQIDGQPLKDGFNILRMVVQRPAAEHVGPVIGQRPNYGQLCVGRER
jgi:hypothetical protein